jgi:hypothetical protein
MSFDRSALDKYAAGSELLAQSIRGLTRDDLLAVPVPGKWSTQTVVLHLLDAETAFADRMKRIIAEENPTLQEWSENLFAEKLSYEKQSAEDAVTIISLVRKNLLAVLRDLPDAAFERTGVHTSRGRQTLAEVLGYAIWHIEHHVKFIHEKRAAMGKEMW